MLRKLQRIRQTCLIWLGRSIREKKRFCAIEGKERLIDCFTHEQDVWSRSFIHKTVKIYSRNHIKQLLTIFCGKPSYSLKQKMIPSGPPLPFPPLCSIPGPAYLAVVHILTNSRILPGATLSTLDSFFIATTIFFSLTHDTYFFFFFFFLPRNS